jgi:hypothetical protein
VLIEADRVNAQTDLLGDNTNLHDLNSSPEATPWSIVQSQVISPVPGIAKLSPRIGRYGSIEEYLRAHSVYLVALGAIAFSIWVT